MRHSTVRQRPPPDPADVSRRAAAIGRALAAIRAESDEHRSLSHLAEIAGYSPFHFARLFRDATGLPPVRFQTAVRLDRAKTLLLTTDQSVTDVCFEVGFQSLGTFTRRFTAAVGLAPSHLRHLPERYGDRVDCLTRLVDDGLLGGPPPATPGGVRGRIVTPSAGLGPCFVGLFPAGIPEGRPIAAAVLPAPGPFRLAPVPDGRFHLLACAMPGWRHPLPGLLADPAVRVGNAAFPITVRRGVGAPVAILLRAPLPTDPPLLVALPALLLEQADLSRHRSR